MKNVLRKKIVLASAVTLVFFLGVEGVLTIADFRYTPREKKFYLPTVCFTWGTSIAFLQTHPVHGQYLFRTQPDTKFTGPHGFRRPEPAREKPAGKIRVAFLGGSTTQGGFLPYPERVMDILNSAAGTELYEGLNAACSSYSTFQSRRLLEDEVLDWNPDMVVVYHGWNDAMCEEDGYSDREKDIIARASNIGLAAGRLKLSRFRIAKAVGRITDLLDFNWPRLRVAPREFRENLDDMAKMCQKQGIPLVVIVRPVSREQAPPRPNHAGHLMGRLEVEDVSALYYRLHEIYTGIQREFVSAYDNVHVCDASAWLDGIQEAVKSGALPSHLRVFEEDATHCTFFGEQSLAECVALAVASGMEHEIRSYLNSSIYHAKQAQNALRDLNTAAAEYYVKEAAAREPQLDLKDLVREIRENSDFADLWRQASPVRPGDFENKLSALKECLKRRPGDAGLCSAVSMLCDRAGERGRADELLPLFVPESMGGLLIWLVATLDVSIAKGELVDVAYYSLMVRRLDPGNMTAAQSMEKLMRRGDWPEIAASANARIGRYDFMRILQDGNLDRVEDEALADDIIDRLRQVQVDPEDMDARQQLKKLCLKTKDLDLYITFTGLKPPCKRPFSALNDGDLTTVYESGEGYVCIQHPEPVRPIRLYMVTHAGGMHTAGMDEVCVIAGNEDPHGGIKWDVIPARLINSGDDWAQTVHLPNAPDGTTLCLELNPEFQMSGAAYTAWGLACGSESRGRERKSGADGGIALRELMVCVDE